MEDIKKTIEKTTISRRGFIKGATAAAAIATGLSLQACKEKEAKAPAPAPAPAPISDPEIAGMKSDDEFYTSTPKFRYGTSAHNCGGRCIIKAQVTEDNRIVRFLTDETTQAYDGSAIDVQDRNSSQFRACSRCRSYKQRLYHPGRLKFPLKQTKKRGDITGFQRISWDQALKEISEKMKAVQEKYGPESMHAIYACGNIYSPFQSASYAGVFASNDQVSPALRLLGGSTGYTSDYSFHQASYVGGWYGTAYTGFNMDGNVCIKPTTDSLAGKGKYVVLWGANTPTTHNPLAFPWVKSIEDMKKRDKDAKVIFIGPELSEIGIASADEWIQIKPYTDTALILAMLHEMLVNTFDKNGNIVENPWLDVDYIDTLVYGFFDSPAYKLNNGEMVEIGTKELSKDVIREVPAGASFSAYILGDESLDKKSGITTPKTNRLMKAKYGKGNYVSAQYGEERTRNASVCSYPSKSKSQLFLYKEDMLKPKTPEWAEKITGVPAAKIRELAKMYVEAGKKNERIWNEWAGGLQKQAEGCTVLMAIQALCILTKDWGYTGTGIMNQGINPRRNANPAQLTNAFLLDDGTGKSIWDKIPAMRTHPQPSVAQWHTAVKFAFAEELAKNGYKATNIADWDNTTNTTSKGHIYFDNGGVKSLVKRDGAYSEEVKTFTDTTVTPNRTYYTYSGMQEGATTPATGTPVDAGFRFILNTGGNIPINQHPNSIDLAKMYEYLPSFEHANGFNAENMADAFYLVTFDNFMSPSARYSDYVLPAKTTWEQEDFKYLDESGGTNLYIDSVIAGPGEAKSTWDFARDLIKYRNGEEAAATFTGMKADSTFKDVVKAKYDKYSKIETINGEKNPYYNKTWEEFLEKPFSTPTYSKEADTSDKASPLRSQLDEYLKTDKTAPFKPSVTVTTVTADNAYGFGNGQFAETETCPPQSGKFHLYMGSLVWRYENAYSKWHGHLPVEKQGQSNKDKDGDPVVYPIIMYYNYEDYFAESYGVSHKELQSGKYFLLTTTHDRFRAHSSHAENPYLRELTHRVRNGALYSGNDFGYYAVSDKTNEEFNYTTFPALNSLIGADGLPVKDAEDKASYTDIWVNPEDFKDFEDGSLVKVYNNVGAVYCTIRKTERCVKGYVGLHEGCWYDPRVINGETVDVGGNCNTLMASRPSRMDHGNGAQSAMVKIEKVEG